MHIEPGILSGAKIAAANLAATALVAAQAPELSGNRSACCAPLLAALFFSVFMQSFHTPAGASELHFIGAMPIYPTLGFVPTLLGFGLGLLLQGGSSSPPTRCRISGSISSRWPYRWWRCMPRSAAGSPAAPRRRSGSVLKLDAAYYAGVAVMVGFWLAMG